MPLPHLDSDILDHRMKQKTMLFRKNAGVQSQQNQTTLALNPAFSRF
jgi:hypothetical protein